MTNVNRPQLVESTTQTLFRDTLIVEIQIDRFSSVCKYVRGSHRSVFDAPNLHRAANVAVNVKIQLARRSDVIDILSPPDQL